MAGLTSFCSPGTAATAPACSQRCSELRLPGAQTTAAVLQGAAAARYQLGPSSIDKLRVRARGGDGGGGSPGWPGVAQIQGHSPPGSELRSGPSRNRILAKVIGRKKYHKLSGNNKPSFIAGNIDLAFNSSLIPHSSVCKDH